jgi:glycerol-3-phosphate dehydrogenase
MNRTEMLQRLREPATWDILVIGGGASGLATAVEAASRGYRTALVEQGDFAQATSSRSTKLIHGGVRYLQQGRLPLVREALRERGYLLQNAPHLVHPLPFVLPLYSWWERPFYGIGLRLYDLLAGKLGIGRTRHLSAEETVGHLPTLSRDGLRGGILFYDGQFDDTRLAITFAQTVADLKGTIANYVKVISLLKRDERVNGVIVRDMESGKEFEIHARVVVNATGIFSDDVRRLDDRAAEPLLAPSQGAHIVLDQSFLPGDHALIIPRTSDGRVFFAIPWHQHTLIGTTDTAVAHDTREPRALESEIEFLLEHAGWYLAKKPAANDILSVFAGLRPLIKHPDDPKTSELSRRHEIIVSRSGLVSLIGGKWTTCRMMAQDTVDKAVAVRGLQPRLSPTRQLRLHGWRNTREASPEFAEYGADAGDVLALCKNIGNAPLHPRLPYRVGQVHWALQREMARTIDDVLSRRLRALFLDAKAAVETAPQVARIMASGLGYDEAWEKKQIADFQKLAGNYLPGLKS